MKIPTLRVTLLLSVYSILAACSTPVSEIHSSPPENSIAWPRPPETARIIFLESFQVPQDLGIRPSAFRRFMSAIAGEKDTGMIRPEWNTGIAFSALTSNGAGDFSASAATQGPDGTANKKAVVRRHTARGILMS